MTRLRLGLPRPLASLLTLLRTDCSHLHAALHKTGIHPTGLCECGKPKTRHHFLLACPLHQVARQQLQADIGADGFDICSLLSDPHIIPFTLLFITSTDRFPRYFANLLSRMLRSPLPPHHQPQHHPLSPFLSTSVRVRPRQPLILLTFRSPHSPTTHVAQQSVYRFLLQLWDSEEEIWDGSPFRTEADLSPRRGRSSGFLSDSF